MRVAWICIGVAFVIACIISWGMDMHGDKSAAEVFALLAFAIGLAACILYGWEYRPMAPSAPDAMEHPVIYDQPIETKD